MRLHELAPKQKRTPRKRIGRGIAAGQGKTAGRGTKGQNARKSPDMPRKFEGGQTPLIQRLPKLNGFRSLKIKPLSLDYAKIEAKFKEGSTIAVADLIKSGLITEAPKGGIKLLGQGEKRYSFIGIKLTKKLALLNKDKKI